MMKRKVNPCYKTYFTITIFISLLFTDCRFPVRKSAELELDSYFLFMDQGMLTVSELKDHRNDSEHLKLYRKNYSTLAFADKNNYYILESKNGNLDLAESGFKKLVIEKPKLDIPFLNLIRMYYILEEFSLARSFASNWATTNRIKLVEFIPFLDHLEKNYRLEERAMLLEGVSTIPGFELYSWRELGKYFLFKKDFASAEFYLQKILVTIPFDEESLVAMAELCLDGKRWSELTDYGKAMSLTPGKKNKSFYYIARGLYERGQFTEANNHLIQAPDSEKVNLDYLLLWRNSLLAENPKNSLLPLRKYFRIIKERGYSGTEEEFLPTLHPHGKEILDSFVR